MSRLCGQSYMLAFFTGFTMNGGFSRCPREAFFSYLLRVVSCLLYLLYLVRRLPMSLGYIFGSLFSAQFKLLSIAVLVSLVFVKAAFAVTMHARYQAWSTWVLYFRLLVSSVGMNVQGRIVCERTLVSAVPFKTYPPSRPCSYMTSFPQMGSMPTTQHP